MRTSYALVSRYIEAFINVLEEKNKMDKIDYYLSLFEKLINYSHENEMFVDLIKNPLIPQNVIVKEILLICETKDEIFENLIYSILKKKRQDSLELFFRVFKEYNRELKRIVKVKLNLAKEIKKSLEEELSSNIKSKTGRDIQLSKEINEDLIGGLQLLIDDKLFDYSVKGYLDRILTTQASSGGEKI